MTAMNVSICINMFMALFNLFIALRNLKLAKNNQEIYEALTTGRLDEKD